MKKFDKKVLWNFRIGIQGNGRNCREALLSAIDNLKNQVINDFHISDFESIEKHEVVSIDESDTE